LDDDLIEEQRSGHFAAFCSKNVVGAASGAQIHDFEAYAGWSTIRE
jgi:hypothetical protein